MPEECVCFSVLVKVLQAVPPPTELRRSLVWALTEEEFELLHRAAVRASEDAEG